MMLSLRHGILVALMITRAALANPVSRGAHFIKKWAKKRDTSRASRV